MQFFFKLQIKILHKVYINFIIFINDSFAKIFSHSFDSIEAEAEMLWRYHMNGLVHEYYHLPWLPPPLSLIINMGLLIKKIARWSCCSVLQVLYIFYANTSLLPYIRLTSEVTCILQNNFQTMNLVLYP